MRNLKAHPLTLTETAQMLRTEASYIDSHQLVGDLRPLAFNNAATILERLGFVDFDLPGMEKRK